MMVADEETSGACFSDFPCLSAVSMSSTYMGGVARGLFSGGKLKVLA